jgi:hypothetical protein
MERGRPYSATPAASGRRPAAASTTSITPIPPDHHARPRRDRGSRCCTLPPAVGTAQPDAGNRERSAPRQRQRCRPLISVHVRQCPGSSSAPCRRQQTPPTTRWSSASSTPGTCLEVSILKVVEHTRQPDLASRDTPRPTGTPRRRRAEPHRHDTVTNPLRQPGRQASDIAHELSHLILQHEVTEIRIVAEVPASWPPSPVVFRCTHPRLSPASACA